MLKYIIKRILFLIPIMLGVIVIIFTLKTITPGDPIDIILDANATEEQREEKREELGLNDPISVQFFNYVKGIVTEGDLGTSYRTGAPVRDELFARLRVSTIICLGGVILGVLIGVPLGIFSALKKYTIVDSAVLVLSMVFTSCPQFVVALLFIYLFSVMLGLLPATGISDIRGYVLPMVVIGLNSMSRYTRVTRSSMLEVLGQDYIRTARAKGQAESKIVTKHALRNAIIPVVNAIGNQFGHLIGGALIIENVFGAPGVGKYISDAIIARNYPSVLGGVLLLAFVFTLINLIVDISYMLIDPRLKKVLIAGGRRPGRRSAA